MRTRSLTSSRISQPRVMPKAAPQRSFEGVRYSLVHSTKLRRAATHKAELLRARLKKSGVKGDGIRVVKSGALYGVYAAPWARTRLESLKSPRVHAA